MDVFLDCTVLPCSMQAVCGSIRPHSCKHGIYEDVWRSAPRRMDHEAATLQAWKEPTSGCLRIPPPAKEARYVLMF